MAYSVTYRLTQGSGGVVETDSSETEAVVRHTRRSDCGYDYPPNSPPIDSLHSNALYEQINI